MGYDFDSADGAGTSLSSNGWRLALQLAERFGWQPAGTEPPEDWDGDRPWNRTYMGNSGQQVTAADSEALAVALRVALASPDFPAIVTACEATFREQLATASTPTVKLTVGHFAPDEWRRSMEAFVAFCERGSFRVH